MHDQASHEEGFIGRHEELQSLFRRAREAGTMAGESLLLAGERGIGKTALLRQLAAHLFWKQDRVVPFFYGASAAFLSTADFARDFLASFLRQRLAFENRDQALLTRVGIPLHELAAYAADQRSTWAWEVIDRYQRAADEPLARLQGVMHAPALSSLETGKPVLLMLDDFPMLAGLHRAGVAEPSLLALFDGPIAARMTPCLLAGRASELRELPLPALTEMPLRPLPSGDAERLFQTMLHARGVPFESVPRPLYDHLGGNPLYIRRVAGAVPGAGPAGEEAFWSAYVQEITSGGLYHYFAMALKTLFPGWNERRNALEVINRICTGGQGTTAQRAVQGYVAQKLSAESFRALLRSGFVLGEFGGYRGPDDPVLRDFIALLHAREIEGRPLDEVVRQALSDRRTASATEVSWSLEVPLTPRSELVVAESLEQIGKNLHVAEDVIGQLQMAVIEACINAIEHSKGGERRLHVSIQSLPDRLEVSVESPGQEFVQAETGEPFVGTAAGEGPPRGQGVKLMKRFADEVRFERTPRGTKVVLVKQLSRTAAIQKEGVSYRE